MTADERAFRRLEAQNRELLAKVERYFGCIATIERERDEWAAVARDAVAGHQRAQELMMEEISRLHRRLTMIASLVADPPKSWGLRWLTANRAWLKRLGHLARPMENPTLERIFGDYAEQFNWERGMPSKIERAPGADSVA